MSSPKDAFGKDLKVGDTVVYQSSNYNTNRTLFRPFIKGVLYSIHDKLVKVLPEDGKLTHRLPERLILKEGETL